MIQGNAIQTEGLTKRYGDRAVVDGVDLAVPAGSVLGLLGPNGAGKTTVVRMLSTLLHIDGGRAEVGGIDVAKDPQGVRRRIGMVGQNAAVDEILGARHNLVLFARLYRLSRKDAGRRADELLEQFDLADTGTRPVKEFSGGMRRRLDLAASLIVAPPVLFLDEPTTGLDPRGRNEMWDAVRSLVGGGTTLLLTTQYLEEADQLARSLCVIDHGRVIAGGTPSELKAQAGADWIDVVLQRADQLAAASAVLERVAGVAPDVDELALRLSVPVADRIDALTRSIGALGDAGIAVDDLVLRRPTLDEVFLRLTGGDAPGAATTSSSVSSNADRTQVMA